MQMIAKRTVWTLASVFAVGAAGVAAALNGSETEAPKVGEMAPDFTLTDTAGNEHTLSDFRGKVVVLEWFNPDCPFVKKFHKNTSVMADTANDWGAELDAEGAVVSRGEAAEQADLDVVFLAINSGAKGKQGNGLERNRRAVEEYKISYPVLLDESGVVGRQYDAKRTPEIFIVGTDGKVIFHGPIDNTSSARTIGDTNYLATALAQYAAGETVVTPSIAPYGCSVKYASR